MSILSHLESLLSHDPATVSTASDFKGLECGQWSAQVIVGLTKGVRDTLRSIYTMPQIYSLLIKPTTLQHNADKTLKGAFRCKS